jgi:hypothetical protein
VRVSRINRRLPSEERNTRGQSNFTVVSDITSMEFGRAVLNIIVEINLLLCVNHLERVERHRFWHLGYLYQ